MKMRNIEKFSTSSVQCLLHRISFDEGIVTPRKMFAYKNNSPRWVIKQILTQVYKQEKINNGNNNNNNNYCNSINENSFINENNCQAPKKQL